MTPTLAQEARNGSNHPLADPALRRHLEDFVRRRVAAADVDDVVQTVLVDALAAAQRPEGREELRRWVIGIARHKVVDAHRRARREGPAEIGELETSAPPLEERSLARWAEEQAAGARDAEKTLGWMAREGEGEKLESIAAEERVPAARVRQRVSRMRRWMKERWLAELAAVAALAVLFAVLWRWLSPPNELPEAKPERPAPTSTWLPEEPAPIERARAIREEALARCDAGAYAPCLEGLDEARALDPAGDEAPEVTRAREEARRALEPVPAPTPTPEAPKVAPKKAERVNSAPTTKSFAKSPSSEPELAKKKPIVRKPAPKSPPPGLGTKD